MASGTLVISEASAKSLRDSDKVLESFLRQIRLSGLERDRDNAYRASRQSDLESTAADMEGLVLDSPWLR